MKQQNKVLLSIAKLQNLKAIHNNYILQGFGFRVVINHKTTKFESNSQQKLERPFDEYSYYQSQNYKIWKQFTTTLGIITFADEMLSIAKLQNLKAIHNLSPSLPLVGWDVINHKITKFESNSQQSIKQTTRDTSCYQSQDYKIWK